MCIWASKIFKGGTDIVNTVAMNFMYSGTSESLN